MDYFHGGENYFFLDGMNEGSIVLSSVVESIGETLSDL